MKKTLYILTYDHGGKVLWGDRIEARLHKVESWLEKYPKFKTGLDYEAFTFDELEENNPELLGYIKKLLDKYKGRIGLGSTTYGQPLSLFITEESNVRQLTEAITTNKRHFGTTPKVYAISEFAFNNQHPQLLKKCGYDSVLFRTHVMNYGYQKSFDEAYGIWKGKDGTEIRAIPAYKDAGEGYTNCTIDNWILTRWPDESQYSLSDFETMYEKYEPLLASRYDDISNGTEELVALAQKTDNYKFVMLDELPGIYADTKPARLDTTDNDFHGRMPWGYCGNEIFNAVRKAETRYLLAERIRAFCELDNSVDIDLEIARKYALCSQHHDVTICGLLDEAREYTGKSLAHSDKVIQSSLKYLSDKFGSSHTDGIVAFNPHSFPVVCKIESDSPGLINQLGEKLPCDKVGNKNVHIATLPPLGISVFTKSEESTPTECKIKLCDDTIITPFYKITFNKNGIKTIFLADGKKIIDNGDGLLFAGAINDQDEYSLGKWNCKVNTHSATLEYIGTVGSTECRFVMNLDEYSPAIDCHTEFTVHGEKIGRTGITKGIHTDYVVNGSVHENKLRFIMNLCLDKDRKMFRDLPFAIAEWTDILPKPEDFWYEGSKVLVDTPVNHEECFNNPCYLQGIYWLALRDKSYGVAVINKGCMGSTVLGNLLSVPLMFATDYMCGTRMLNGTFPNDFQLLFYDNKTSNIDIHRDALQLNLPALYTETLAGKDKLNGFSPIEACVPEDVILTAFFKEDGRLYARYCNYSDEKRTINFVKNPLAETDLLGNCINCISKNTVDFNPWEIKTLQIQK